MATKTFTQLTAETALAAADEFPFWDASAAAARKVTVANLFKALPAGGSQATPGLAFESDADTGFYSSVANTLRVTVGGLLAMAYDGTGSYGRVKMGGGVPSEASALLDLSSTVGALLVPRMTTTQRDALTPVNGMIIYNSTANQMQGYINSAWTAM